MKRISTAQIRDLLEFVSYVGGNYAYIVEHIVTELLQYREVFPMSGKYQVAAWDCVSITGKQHLVRATNDDPPAGFKSAEPLYRILT